MPKRVDVPARRRAIADAVLRVIDSRGLESVGLRDVAAEAGISMGLVQHYFATKRDLMLFSLAHRQDRVLTRMTDAVAALDEPARRERLRATLEALLPVDEPRRLEARAGLAFLAVAAVRPEYATALRAGHARLLAAAVLQLRTAERAGDLAGGLDVDAEAAALFFAVQGMVGPVLVGILAPQEALDLLDRRLDRVFR